MKKRNVSLLSKALAGVMLMTSIAGCGSQGSPDNSGSSNSADAGTTSETIDNEAANMEISRTIKISLEDVQKVNDTNGDGYGEFEGWGTSLCWWANRVGYSDKLTTAAAEAFFNKDTGLGMNIGRYNVGGGDNVAEGTVTDKDRENNPFLHESHIRRSDSVVPGYCTDVTKIDLSTNTKEYYEENFERANFECGFAWNYNWDADVNQMNVLTKAMEQAGDEFIPEAFSNSPPYFMTVSGCSSGGEDPSVDNLREDSYTAFAWYMADVIEHWAKENVVTFQSVDPMNEPATSYWQARSEKQEGCHFSQGESQSRILVELNKELQNKGIDMIISASDETSLSAAIMGYKSLTDEAKGVVTRIDTHTYQGTERQMLRQLAEENGMNLWMSEVDGTFSIGKKETGMQAALGFADAIIQDLNGLKPAAWIMWDAVDVHVDSNNRFDTCTRQQADEIVSSGEPFWGIAIADHDTEELLLTKKYYAYGQFSRYIRPGYCIIESSDTSVAAYNPEDGSIVIVAINTNSDDLKWEFDLSDLDVSGKSITAIRTSGAMEDGENWADVTDSDGIVFDESAGSFTAVMKGSSITTYIIK
ncbi:glycoside hydrolase [Butyrivibrio proteoclasticus]|uniref:glycoside hydrolase n=1 Tax=Butyrivibrio proteoclasticus TaxID=43305 RepID=UPI000479D530|nr:glycoside hydrolase [Butyrivibrio proteoclasticus]